LDRFGFPIGPKRLATSNLRASAASIDRLDLSTLQPGDLAVTEDGIHVLAFLGDRRWIEADPEAGGVAVVRVPASANAWFETPVRLMRWRILDRTEF
jgi:hypothetical protein